MSVELGKAGAWRISSVSKHNLDLAVEHRTWGASRNYLIGHLRAGDRLVLYVSRPPAAGYWGLGTVTRELFVSNEPIWGPTLFRYRFGFAVDGLLEEPVPKRTLFEAMPRRGNKRFEYSQPSGVMRLTPHEFGLIAALMREHCQRLE